MTRARQVKTRQDTTRQDREDTHGVVLDVKERKVVCKDRMGGKGEPDGNIIRAAVKLISGAEGYIYHTRALCYSLFLKGQEGPQLRLALQTCGVWARKGSKGLERLSRKVVLFIDKASCYFTPSVDNVINTCSLSVYLSFESLFDLELIY